MDLIKKTASVILALMLILTMLPSAAFADSYSDGDIPEEESLSCSIDSEGILTWNELSGAAGYRVKLETNLNSIWYEVYSGGYLENGLSLKPLVDDLARYKELDRDVSSFAVHVYALNENGEEYDEWQENFYYRTKVTIPEISLTINKEATVTWDDVDVEHFDHYDIIFDDEKENMVLENNTADTVALYKVNHTLDGHLLFRFRIIAVSDEGYIIAESEQLTVWYTGQTGYFYLEGDLQPKSDGTFMSFTPMKGAEYYSIWALDRNNREYIDLDSLPFNINDYIDKLEAQGFNVEDGEYFSLDLHDADNNFIARGEFQHYRHYHTEEIIPAVEPTCTEVGYSEGVRCSECGMIIVPQEEIPAKGHNFVEVEGSEIEATCTVEGKYPDKKCTDCGAVESGKYTYPLGHDYGEWVTTIEPTCTVPGQMEAVCKRCGFILTEEIHQLSHDLVRFERKEPTVYSDGNIEYWFCNRCGKYFDDEAANKDNIISYEDTVIPALPGNILDSGHIGDEISYTLYDDGLMVISGSGEMKAEFMNPLPWEGYIDSIKEVVIKEGITSITYNAFKDCPALERVTLAESINNIGSSAFENCISLKSINIPRAVIQIPSNMFNGCTSLESISLPDSLIGIYYQAFKDCENLVSIDIPENIRQINERTFSGCKKLQNINLPSDLNILGNYVFYGCESLKSVYLPEKTNSFGIGVFEGCTALEQINIPDGLTFITNSAFRGCKNLKTLILTENVDRIGPKVFENCTGLKKITIPQSVRAFGDDIFNNCSSLESIYVVQNSPADNFEGFDSTLKKYVTPSDGHYYYNNIVKATLTKDGSVDSVCTVCDEPGPESKVISHPEVFTLSATSYTYTGGAKKPGVTIKDAEGNVIDEDNYSVGYSNNVKAGTATAKVTFEGDYYSGTKSLTFKINPKKITPSVTLSTSSYTFDGKVKKPTVTVKNGSTKLTTASYTVTYADGRKNVGSYKVTVKLKGNYSGSKTVTFKINPKGTTLKTLTATSKGFKVTWNKQATKMATSYITGYEIQYSTSSKFASGNKSVKVAKYSTLTKTISKLTAKKKYYVRIRTYKTVSGVTYYSPWSASKYVTTKA